MEKGFYLHSLQKPGAHLQREFETAKQLRDLQGRPVCVQGGGELYRPSKLIFICSCDQDCKMIKFVSSEELLLDSVEHRNVI